MSDALKKMILLAADLRESPLNYESGTSDFGGRYLIRMDECASFAAKQIGELDLELPTYLLLSNSWNDALEWAGDYKGREPLYQLKKADIDAIIAARPDPDAAEMYDAATGAPITAD